MLKKIKEDIIEKIKTLPIRIKGAAIYGSMTRSKQKEESDECLSNFRNHNPLFPDIAREGIILCDDDFLKSMIEETRAYISEKKLRKLEDGWIFPVPYRTSSENA